MEHYAGYTVAEMTDCVRAMLTFLSKERKYHAIHTKYSSSKFMKAAVYTDDWVASKDGCEDWDMLWV